MKITGVICEYNPFHNGHEWMLRQLRKNGSTHIIACMSGNFTQRGEPAIFDKSVRTRAALYGGADLVIELPVTFACAWAERFAYGGVSLLDSLGCTDEIAFGSECGKADLLFELASMLGESKFNSKLQEFHSCGISYAAARQKAADEIFGKKYSSLLSEPNNILGIEYCKALIRIGSNIKPVSVIRTGVSHNSRITDGNIASAHHIRSLIDSGKNYLEFVPLYAADIFSKADNKPPHNGRMAHLEQSILYRLRMMSTSELSCLPDISEGLENRIFSAVRTNTKLSDIISSVTSKRYPRSRIARIIMNAFLGITKNDLLTSPPYIRILGMNNRGREILRLSAKKSSVPIVMRYADIRHQPDEVKKQFSIESRCDDIYTLSGEKIGKCGNNMIYSPVIL